MPVLWPRRAAIAQVFIVWSEVGQVTRHEFWIDTSIQLGHLGFSAREQR